MYDVNSSGTDTQAIDRARPQKLYLQIVEIIKAHIEKGEWKVGLQIPTEEQLCSQYGVSRATVRLAIGELVSLGYLKKLQGKGTFVRRKKTGHSIVMLTNLGEDCLCQNSSHLARVLENRTLYPDQGVKTYLNLCEGDYCFYLLRLLFIEGKPLSAQKTFIPADLLPGSFNAEDTHEVYPYAFLENRYGVRIQRVKEMIDVAPLSAQDAGLLEVEQETAALRIRHICYSAGDRPAIYSESFYRTETEALTSVLERIRI